MCETYLVSRSVIRNTPSLTEYTELRKLCVHVWIGLNRTHYWDFSKPWSKLAFNKLTNNKTAENISSETVCCFAILRLRPGVILNADLSLMSCARENIPGEGFGAWACSVSADGGIDCPSASPILDIGFSKRNVLFVRRHCILARSLLYLRDIVILNLSLFTRGLIFHFLGIPFPFSPSAFGWKWVRNEESIVTHDSPILA